MLRYMQANGKAKRNSARTIMLPIKEVENVEMPPIEAKRRMQHKHQSMRDINKVAKSNDCFNVLTQFVETGGKQSIGSTNLDRSSGLNPVRST